MNKFIPKYHFRKGLRHECEVIDLEHFCANNRKIILKPHRTNFNQLFYFHKAKGIHTVDFEDITLADNSLLFAPKDTVHRFDDIRQRLVGCYFFLQIIFFAATRKIVFY